MTVRADLTIDYTISPRVVTVAAPSVVLILQDLYDTLAFHDAKPQNMDDLVTVVASGKETLGGGVFVAVTLELQNTQLAFQERDMALSVGTATSNNVGTILTDISATFITDTVSRGDLVTNTTDSSVGTVMSVESETSLMHTQLTGGAQDDWDIGEAYQILDVIQCNVSGGNIVAVDGVGDPLNPIFATFGTQVVIAQSSSATILTSASDSQAFVDELMQELVDGVRVDNILTKLLSVATGRIVADADPPTTITYFAQDNVTPIFVLDLASVERTRQ